MKAYLFQSKNRKKNTFRNRNIEEKTRTQNEYPNPLLIDDMTLDKRNKWITDSTTNTKIVIVVIVMNHMLFRGDCYAIILTNSHPTRSVCGRHVTHAMRQLPIISK